MTYSFKTSPRGETKTLILEDYSFILREGNEEEVVSYASILSVRISKKKNNYVLHLYPDDHAPIVASSQSFSEEGTLIDQSGGYSLFVRVLHNHLREESQARFASGTNLLRIWIWAGILGLFGLTILWIPGTSRFQLLNPYVVAISLVIPSFIIILLLFKNSPKSYSPTEIPLQFLP